LQKLLTDELYDLTSDDYYCPPPNFVGKGRPKDLTVMTVSLQRRFRFV